MTETEKLEHKSSEAINRLLQGFLCYLVKEKQEDLAGLFLLENADGEIINHGIIQHLIDSFLQSSRIDGIHGNPPTGGDYAHELIHKISEGLIDRVNKERLWTKIAVQSSQHSSAPDKIADAVIEAREKRIKYSNQDNNHKTTTQ